MCNLHTFGIQILYKNELVSLPLNSYILDVAFSDYGNGLGVKQTYTSNNPIVFLIFFWITIFSSINLF